MTDSEKTLTNSSFVSILSESLISKSEFEGYYDLVLTNDQKKIIKQIEEINIPNEIKAKWIQDSCYHFKVEEEKVKKDQEKEKLAAENEMLADRVQKQNKAIYDLKEEVIKKNEDIAKLVRKEFFPTNLPTESRSQESSRRGNLPAFPQRSFTRK